MSAVYYGVFADRRLWTSGWGRTVRSSANGVADRIWLKSGSSIAPDGEDCWIVNEGRICLLTSLPRHRYRVEPDDMAFMAPTCKVSGVRRSFRLGSNPIVCRCDATSDVVALAGGHAWLLNNGSAKRLSAPKLVSCSQDGLDAESRDSLLIWRDDYEADRIWLTFLTSKKIIHMTIPGTCAMSAIRATRQTAFVVSKPTASSQMLTLYRIDIASGTTHPIARFRRDYMEKLVWDRRRHCLYVNYSDDTDHSRVESMTPTGQVMWKSEQFDECVTGISTSDGKNEIYCVTKAGPIYVLPR